MSDFKKEYWVLPTMAIKLVDDLFLYGSETQESISNKRELEKTREGWIAAIYLLRKILVEGRLWYLRKNDIQNSICDIYARPVDLSRGLPFSEEVLPIQVFRRTKYSPGNIIQSITNKLKGDLANTSLVCYDIREEKVDWFKINKSLKEINPNVKEISIIGNLSERKFIIGEVFPRVFISTVMLDLISINGPKMIEAERVVNPLKAGVKKIGEAILTTEFEIKDISDIEGFK